MVLESSRDNEWRSLPHARTACIASACERRFVILVHVLVVLLLLVGRGAHGLSGCAVSVVEQQVVAAAAQAVVLALVLDLDLVLQ